MRSTRRIALILSVLALSIALDLGSKMVVRARAEALPRYYLSGVVRISHWENTGTIMGLGDGLPRPVRFWSFSVLVGVIAVGLIAGMLTNTALKPATAIAGALVAGGSLSNVIDRLLHQEQVLDFINIVVTPIHLIIFNLADVAIALGIMIFGVSAFRRSPRSCTRPGARK